MNREHSVSWAGAEYHPDHARYKYALPTIDLRRDQALPTTQLRPKQTYPRLIDAVLPLPPTHIRPDLDCSRSTNGDVAGEATHKGSLKVSLGFWQGRRPLINIRVASFKKSIPSIHSRLMRSILLRMFQTGLLTMRSFLSILIMICSIAFAESAISSADDASPLE